MQAVSAVPCFIGWTPRLTHSLTIYSGGLFLFLFLFFEYFFCLRQEAILAAESTVLYIRGGGGGYGNTTLNSGCAACPVRSFFRSFLCCLLLLLHGDVKSGGCALCRVQPTGSMYGSTYGGFFSSSQGEAEVAPTGERGRGRGRSTTTRGRGRKSTDGLNLPAVAAVPAAMGSGNLPRSNPL